MRARFGRRYLISAAHRLHTPALGAEENRRVYGKCNNPHGHGHNYTIDVLVEGEVDPASGMAINLVDLDFAVRERVLNRFDHTNLNLDLLFQDRAPTTENFCVAVFDLLEGQFAPAELVRVRIEETENNFFECWGG